MEDEVATQKRAMDADLREKVAEAERLRATVEELRNATSLDVAASEAGILGLQVRRGLAFQILLCVCAAVLNWQALKSCTMPPVMMWPPVMNGQVHMAGMRNAEGNGEQKSWHQQRDDLCSVKIIHQCSLTG